MELACSVPPLIKTPRPGIPQIPRPEQPPQVFGDGPEHPLEIPGRDGNMVRPPDPIVDPRFRTVV